MLSNNLLFKTNEMRQKKKTQRVCLMLVIQQTCYVPDTEFGVEQRLTIWYHAPKLPEIYQKRQIVYFDENSEIFSPKERKCY